MLITRRSVLGVLAASTASALQLPEGLAIAKGPFEGTRPSLEKWRVPDWFQDAKFGIWAHWGPQSAAEYGDWYARRMYEEGGAQYKYHVQTYGHPSKFGFKDVIATWKADQFDPDALMDLYKKAGAKYFVSMGVHHDNFDLWDSKYQPRWNSVHAGPKKDVVGLFRKAALRHGLRFGVSEHLSNSYNWLATSHRSDKEGPYAGVPYDGADPRFADLYHDVPPEVVRSAEAMSRNVPDAWKRRWFLRIKDLVDKYEPDLLYTDGAIPFEEYGLNLVAHLYNANAKRKRGMVEAVFTSKHKTECATGMCVLDLERGVADSLLPNTWQTDTCVGNWHYNKEAKYKSPKRVIDMLVDIVSRNGNLLLNFPLPNSGALDSQELRILSEITAWMAINGDGIYSSRPWKIFGEGPGTAPPPPNAPRFNENARQDLTAADVRFTVKGKMLYAFVMGMPEKEAIVRALGTGSAQSPGRIQNVELLGYGGKLTWKQDQNGLTVQMPPAIPSAHVLAFQITGA